ncbi:Ig-like domain-containing protein [Myxococcus faecalis]|uniref:Ig-like domain-containing protein n=1 Tax=Myxococcus faecalis TaxID=3115646 RepID=UPI0038D15045
MTNGSVDIRVELSGAVPERVELLVDGRVREMLLPPYTLSLDTQALEEGDHELFVRTTLGDQQFLSERRELKVDRTRPVLVSRHPAPGERWVPVRQVTRLEFSEAIDPATIHEGAVRLEAGSKVIAGVVEGSVDGKSLTIQPMSPLPRNVSIQVNVDSSLADLAGNLIQPEGGEWSWVVPDFLPLGSSFPTESPQDTRPKAIELLVPASGLPIMAWANPGTGAVFVRQWSGEGWVPLGSPTPISTGAAFFDARLDRGGHPVVAWVGEMLREIHVWRWTGDGWAPMGGVIDGLSSDLTTLSLRTNGKGEWFLCSSTRQEFFVWKWHEARWIQLGLFQATANWSVVAVHMELDDAGNPLILMEERESIGAPRHHHKWWSLGRWTSISSSLDYLGGWSWGVSIPGRSLVVSPGGVNVIVFKWFAGGWGQLGSIFSERFPGGSLAKAHRFAEDPSGRLVVMLGESEGAGQPDTVHFRRLTNEDWEPLESVLRPAPGVISSALLRFGITPAGRLLVGQVESLEATPTLSSIQVYISND